MESMTGDWRDRAKCLGSDPQIFFPMDEFGVVGVDTTKKAKAICAQCPVRDNCLTYAIEEKQNNGIWGGKTEKERRAEKRRIVKERGRRNLSRRAFSEELMLTRLIGLDYDELADGYL